MTMMRGFPVPLEGGVKGRGLPPSPRASVHASKLREWGDRRVHASHVAWMERPNMGPVRSGVVCHAVNVRAGLSGPNQSHPAISYPQKEGSRSHDGPRLWAHR